MKKLILTALIAVSTLTVSAQEMTLKGLISELSSQSTIQKVTELLQTPRFAKVLDELNEDLTFNFQNNKVTVSSASNFEFIKINGQHLPRKANATVEFMGISLRVSKKSGTFTLEAF